MAEALLVNILLHPSIFLAYLFSSPRGFFTPLPFFQKFFVFHSTLVFILFVGNLRTFPV